MLKYSQMVPFFSNWTLNNLKNKIRKKTGAKMSLLFLIQARLEEYLGGKVRWSGMGQLTHPVLGILAKQSTVWALQVCSSSSSLPRGKRSRTELCRLSYSSPNHQSDQSLYFPTVKERLRLCLWSILPHRSKKQGKGVTPLTVKTNFYGVISGDKCTGSRKTIILKTTQICIFWIFLILVFKTIIFLKLLKWN